jgi:hypothetical protein
MNVVNYIIAEVRYVGCGATECCIFLKQMKYQRLILFSSQFNPDIYSITNIKYLKVCLKFVDEGVSIK